MNNLFEFQNRRLKVFFDKKIYEVKKINFIYEIVVVNDRKFPYLPFSGVAFLPNVCSEYNENLFYLDIFIRKHSQGNDVGYINWDEVSCGFYIEWIYGGNDDIDLENTGGFEVVGNYLTNPEMLDSLYWENKYEKEEK